MKYVLVDKNTGNFVQSTRSTFRIEFTREIHNSALFASAENAGKALRKIIDKNGNYKCGCWQLASDDPTKHLPSTFYVTEEIRAKRVESLSTSIYYQDLIEETKQSPIAGFDLEVRQVQFTLV